MKRVVPFGNGVNAGNSKSPSLAPVPTREAVDGAVYHAKDEAKQQLQLMQRIIGCTDTSELLAHFFYWASDLGLAAGMRYRSGSEHDEQMFGHQRHHSASYTLNLEGAHLGGVTIYRRTRFNENELLSVEQALATFARCLRAAREFAEMKAMLTIDALTGLGNRTSLHEWIDRELSRTQRHKSPLSLMMIDIDHFKRLNDRLGHLGGDRVLKTIADVFRRSTRGSDLLFRYGGDEFTILLPHTDSRGAEDAARQIRENLAAVCDSEHGLGAALGDLCLDISIGVSTYQPGDTENSLLQRADTHLYHAKANGRGAVCTSV